MKRVSVFMGCLAFAGIAVNVARAQVDTATIVGTVQDSSGAVVPSASVTATVVNTNSKISTKTDSSGNYVITPLKIGGYTVAVEAQGFKKETRSGIVLQVQDRLRVDFTLEVGSIAESVNIAAEVPVVQTESSALGDVIGSRQITDLPLNGRDYTQLATLTTGVAKITENGGGINGATSATNGNAGGAFAVNGTRGNLNNFMLDGIDNNSNDNAGNILKTSVDAIEEFKVQTSNYSAEFGRSGGAVINATIKSGTNEFHGTAFEFLRNSALDARDFFAAPDQPKAPFKQNQFGGTLGGPIKKNKLFFFGDYQGTRVSAATAAIYSVPTPAEVNGDFSGILGSQVATDALGRPVYQHEIFDPNSTRTVGGSIVRDGFGFDPTTGLPIAGQANIIPQSRLDTIGHNMATLYPAPNVAGALANNYNVNPPGHDKIDQMDARGDYNISTRQQIFGRFSLSQRTRFQAPPFPGLADGGSYSTGNYLEGTRGAVLAHTFTISPSMVNEVRVGFNRNHYKDNIPAYGQKYPGPGFAVPGVPDNATVNGLTLFSPSGYRRIGEPGFTPTFSTSQEFQYGDTLNIVHGKHVIKLGPQVRFSQFNLFQVGQPRGRFNFSGQFTRDPISGDGGNGLADMLVGMPASSTISTLTYFGNRQRTYGAFVQDDYKLSSSLTLNLGLRYDYTTPITEAHNRQSNFDFSTGQLIVAGKNGNSDGLVTTDKADFSPRLGLAWSPLKSRKIVVRAGYGRFFSYQEIRTGDPLQLGYNLPFFFEPSFVSDGITPVLTVSGGFPSLDISQAKLAGVTSNDRRLHAPVTDEWNLNIQNQLPGNILIEAAYVGAKGTHLQVLVDHNQDPTPGPGDVQSRRPYPQYGPFTSIEDHGNSSYHSLQLKAEKRLSSGLMFLSAFTYSKSINDQPEICCSSPWPQNSFNLASEKGLSDFDNRLRWVSSFDYELPVGKGRRYLNNNRTADLIVGGWHVGGIFTLRSGFPFSPLMSYDPSNTGSNGLLRTDRIANGNFSPGKRTPDLWFDINAFPNPNPNGYEFGNAGKNILDGPGAKTADISIRKLFTITERINLEFRTEFFNAFNHAVFGQPDGTIADGPGAAGVITSTVIPQRQLQFALKLHF